MSDRHWPSSTLVLRVLPAALQDRLREKMAESEELASQKVAVTSSNQSSEHQSIGGLSVSDRSVSKEEQIIDLEGVICIPSEDGSTLWNFECDGVRYPARLENMPCPVEIHKTFDHALYYKCVDVGQILIVYEDKTAMEEAESSPGYKSEGFPSYYHSGLTPPMKRVVERRFLAREHKSVAPPRAEVSDIEKELKSLIGTISRDASKSRGKVSSNSNMSQQDVNKVIEEVVDDLVDYQPWMDDFGNHRRGIEFDEKDKICTSHPELWLKPEESASFLGAEALSKKEDSKKKKKQNSNTKKKEKKSKLKSSSKSSSDNKKKKGIASKKNRTVDEVDQAAAQIVTGDDGDALEVLGDFFDFNGDDELTDFLKEQDGIDIM